MKLLIAQLLPFSCLLFSLRYKHSPQHTVLKHPVYPLPMKDNVEAIVAHTGLKGMEKITKKPSGEAAEQNQIGLHPEFKSAGLALEISC
jgi:hypothetical protein